VTRLSRFSDVVALVSALALVTGTIHGTVTRGPIAPVCRVGTPCRAPAKNVTLSFTRNGSMRTTTTDDRGRYSIGLSAGVYAVKTDQRPFGTVPRPKTIRVKAARSTRVDFAIDTGIR
jgi:Carboxypeptidase regulatory-like domain